MEQEIKGDLTSLKPLEYFNPTTNEWCIEEFRPIKDYEGLYEISNLGRVKSLPKTVGSRFREENKILKSGANQNGYLFVRLCSNDDGSVFYIHKLVWDHFGDKPRNGRKLQVDHKDENNQNNRIENLQLLTPRANTNKHYGLTKTNGLPTGVCWHKRDKKFRAQIVINKKKIFIGSFDNPQKAGEAYEEKLRDLYKQ